MKLNKASYKEMKNDICILIALDFIFYSKREVKDASAKIHENVK